MPRYYPRDGSPSENFLRGTWRRRQCLDIARLAARRRRRRYFMRDARLLLSAFEVLQTLAVALLLLCSGKKTPRTIHLFLPVAQLG